MWEEAAALYPDLLPIQETDFTEFETNDEIDEVDFPALANTYSDLGEIYVGLGDELKAKTAFRLARVIQDFSLKQRQAQRMLVSGESTSGDKFKALRIDRDLLEMGDLFVRLGRFGPAETAYRHALEAAEDDPNFEAEIMLKTGHLYRIHLKNYDKAAEAYRAAVGTLSNERGSPLLLGEAMTQLGGLFAIELHRYDDAVKLFDDALKELSELPGSERARYSTLDALAGVYRIQQKTPEVVAASRRKLAVAREMLARNSPNSVAQKAWDADAYAEAFGLVVRAVGDLSDAFRAAGDAEAAKSVYGVLLEDDLDVAQVVDEQVVAAYAEALEANREHLRALIRPPSAGGNVAQRITSARAKQTQIGQITRSQQVRQQVQQTYAPAATPR